MKTTSVESQFLQNSKQLLGYPGEYVPIIEVPSVPQLGKLTALRFLEWIITNPTGVIALPTGSTPKSFINQLKYFKQHWHHENVQNELHQFGITTKNFPDTSHVKFVQLDEFYPIDVSNTNSFTHYIKTQYLPLLNLKPKNTLLFKQYKQYAVEEMCDRYEQQIEDWGGIGFLLSGIGPDGHIAFNMPGAAFTSKTRLVIFNYKTAAAAAWSLGGIEFSRNKTAVTIGLKTITMRADATIVIIAAGQNKASVIADAIEKQPSRESPATALHNHTGARFYITQSAAAHLMRHKKEQKNNTPEEIIAKINAGLQPIINKQIMHAEPHHDDIMLGYYPYAIRLLTNNNNQFVSVTSGYNAVTNSFILDIIKQLPYSQLLYLEKDIFKKAYPKLLNEFANAYKNKNQDKLNLINTIIFAHKAKECFNAQTINELNTSFETAKKKLEKTMHNPNALPAEIKKLKGLIRETEADCLWALHNVPLKHVTHMHAQFYHQKTNNYTQDVKVFHSYLDQFNPAIITLTFDPPATSADTHYHVLQMIAQALRTKNNLNSNLRIWAYRNVWYRFTIAEATHIIPVSKQELTTWHNDFCFCFNTQKQASFPSTEFDGPFSQLAVSITQEQLQNVKNILGTEYFDYHTDPRMQTAVGLLFFKEMNISEFLHEAKMLQKHTPHL